MEQQSSAHYNLFNYNSAPKFVGNISITQYKCLLSCCTALAQTPWLFTSWLLLSPVGTRSFSAPPFRKRHVTSGVASRGLLMRQKTIGFWARIKKTSGNILLHKSLAIFQKMEPISVDDPLGNIPGQKPTLLQLVIHHKIKH